MTMDFHLEGANGESGILNTSHVMTQLQQGGYNPQSVSPDGMTLTLQDEQGAYQIPTHEALKGLGWNVKEMTPQNADYDNVQPEWRAAVHKLDNDDMRRAFITGKLKALGHEDAQVIGSGRDWHVFNPETKQWMGVTNSPEWDKSDLVEAGLEIPRMLASGVGGGAGALLGGGTPASIAGAAAGAGLGGGAVDALERSVLAAKDSTYADVLRAHSGDAIRGMLTGAALDAGSAGLIKGAPALARAFSPTAGKVVGALANAAPVSNVLQAGGKGAQLIGKGTAQAAKFVDNPLGRDVIAQMLPGVGTVNAMGAGLALPRDAIQAIPKAAGWLAEREGLRSAAPEAASKLTGMAVNLSKKIPQAAAGTAAKVRSGARGLADLMEAKGAAGAEEAFQPTAESILGRAGNSLGKMAHEIGSTPSPKSILSVQPTALKSWRLAREFGLSPQEAGKIARPESWFAARAASGKAAAKVGERFGRGLDYVGDIGDALQTGTRAVSGGLIKGARYGGRALQGGGYGAEILGTLAKPLESRAALRYGAEEAFGHDLEEMDPWRKRHRRAIMGEALADN